MPINPRPADHRWDLHGLEIFFGASSVLLLLSAGCTQVKFCAVSTAERCDCLFLQVVISQFSTWEVTGDHLFPLLLFHYPGAIWRWVAAGENCQYKITKKTNLPSLVLNIIFESPHPAPEIFCGCLLMHWKDRQGCVAQHQ